jgi:PAS domain S-box-containing protein
VSKKKRGTAGDTQLVKKGKGHSAGNIEHMPRPEPPPELLQVVTQVVNHAPDLKAFVDSVEDIVFALDRNERHIGVFGRWMERFGLGAEHFLGRTAGEVLGAEAAAVHQAANRRALAGEHVVYEWSVETSEGMLSVQTSLSPLRDAKGDIVGIIGVGRDITERKRMDEALRASEDRYRDLVEHSQDLICTHDLEGRILSVNRAAAKLLGYDPNDYVGKRNVRDILAPEARDGFDAYMATIRKEGVVRGLMVVLTSTGERRIWEYNNTLRTEGVAAPVVRGMAHDITERWRAEQALRRSQQQYQGLVESVSDIVFSLDQTGRITYVNPAVEQVGGYAPEELIGKPFSDFIHPVDQEAVEQLFARRLEGDTRPGEFRVVVKNGAVRYLQSVGQPLIEDGRVVGVTGILRDVTEQRRAEERLARIYDIVTRYQGQELFDHAAGTLAELLDTAYVFICELEQGSESVRVLASHNQKGITPGAQYDISSTPCELVIRDRSGYNYSRDVRRLFPGDADLAAWGIESYIAAPITDSRGEVLGIVTAFDERPKEFSETEERILRIVGQRVGAEIIRLGQEQAQRRLQEQLFEAQKMESIGTLAGGVAHEFNNLLTGIMGFTEMALLKLGRRHELAGHLNHVLSLSGRARDLVQQMLLFSRPAAGEKQRCNLHEFLNDLALLLRRTIPQHISIQLGLASDDIFVEVNPLQLQQMLVNIAVNARDAMPEGGRIRIATELTEVDEKLASAYTGVKPGPFVRVTISDTGEGIPPQVQAHIFEPFFTTKEVGKGIGLGLSVVYGVVRAHGGWIEVQSAVGHGASFRIYLPVAERQIERTRVLDDTIVGGSETILLVEDEPMVLGLGRTVLETLGYRVLTAQDGEQAVEVYARHQETVDLVLLDVVMPQMSGYRAFAQLRRLNPQVKILLVTGYSPEDVAEELLDQGAEGIVQKPYDLKTLASSIRHSLDRGIVRSCSS